MKKYFALIGMLLLAGVSFADSVGSGPEWNVFLDACCRQYALYKWAGGAANYQVTDTCATRPLIYDSSDLIDLMWASGATGPLYDEMVGICGHYGQTSSECINAKRAFYSSARATNNALGMARMDFLLASRQAIYAYSRHTCATEPAMIYNDILGIRVDYNSCVEEGCYRP